MNSPLPPWHLRRPLPSHGFSLAEFLVVVVIIGILAALGIEGLLFIIRRARVQSAAMEVAGWLEQVRNVAANKVTGNSAQGGCVVTFKSGDKVAGDTLAEVDADCPALPQRILKVPEGVQKDSVTLSLSGSNPFTYTPRGMWIDAAGDPGSSFQLTINLNGGKPVRCVRLSPVLGSVQIGKPASPADSTCGNWQTL